MSRSAQRLPSGPRQQQHKDPRAKQMRTGFSLNVVLTPPSRAQEDRGPPPPPSCHDIMGLIRHSSALSTLRTPRSVFWLGLSCRPRREPPQGLILSSVQLLMHLVSPALVHEPAGMDKQQENLPSDSKNSAFKKQPQWKQ
uniref:Uncharacterized protein n=1 Tax=Knipowitschia caucasica TaxID=637954 RepID=A0AAV2JZB5_KNICA